MEILPYLTTAKRGYPCKGDLCEVIQCIFSMMDNAGISIDGLFLNADAGFDCHDFRRKCDSAGIIANVDFNNHTKNDEKYLLDRELLSLRYSIERTNAWMDSFRSVVSTKRFPAGKGGISWHSM